ncbi:MAG: hypothetical protein ACRENK_13130 [Gemmatimonadaceae bacterium]
MRVKNLLVISLSFVPACKPPTPAEQMDSILSWVATAGMAGEAWLRHTTLDRYSRQTLELSNETILQISSGLLKSPPPTLDSASLDSIITTSRAHIAKMARLIEARNSPDFSKQLDSLRAEERIIKQLAESAQQKQ